MSLLYRKRYVSSCETKPLRQSKRTLYRFNRENGTFISDVWVELRSRRWLQSLQQTPIGCQRQHLVFVTVHRGWAVRDARQPPPAALVLVLAGELHFRILSTPTRAPPGRSRAERRAAACRQSPSPGAARTRPQRAAQPPGAGSPRACSSRRCLGSRGLRRRRRQCRAAPRLR